MINISNAKWFNKNGFDGKIVKQYVSKTIFEISKDGILDKFELPQGIIFKNIKAYMEQFMKNWDMYCELYKLRKYNEFNFSFGMKEVSK